MTENDSEESLIGYARVSTVGQTLDSQLEQLRGAGCTKIYREKVTRRASPPAPASRHAQTPRARRRGDRDTH
jgi:hypothetical protein